MDGRLGGKVALITGAASGIGRSCALRFAEEGASIVVADLDGERAAGVVAEVTRAGGVAEQVVVDTSSASSCDAMAAAAVEAFGRIDTCVAAAGISHARYVSREVEEQVGVDRMDRSDMYLLDKSLESWQRVLDVNLTGVMLTDRAVARTMVERGGGGTIVNIASMAAVTALTGAADYCVSKAGVWMLTKCLAVELARHRIRVNAVGPGYIKTPMSGSSLAHQPWVDSRIAETPLRRLGEPIDIANACLYLACDESSFVTGEIIFPDGGLGAAVRA
jgi:NAD(P)-dependent dehydrogenase (short-subunit alcohol dehydrogenase family)